MVNLEDISYNLQSGKARETSALITRAIAENHTFDNIVKHGIIAGMQAVEARYGRNQIMVPELHQARRAMDRGIRQIKQAIASAGNSTKGTAVIGTVEGDIEDRDKNIAAVMMECRGLKVIDLGTGVSSAHFVDIAKTEKAQVIVCLASLVTTMGQMKVVIQEAVAAGIRNRVKIILLGAPVTERYCQLIGADMYAPDAVVTADLAEAYCGAIHALR